MSLKLSVTPGPSYNYVSSATNLSPVSVTAILPGGGGAVTPAARSLYLVADSLNYTNIQVSLTSEEANINWEVSTDNVTWAESISLPDMNATSSTQETLFYARVTVTDTGIVPPGSYIGAKIQIAATGSVT